MLFETGKVYVDYSQEFRIGTEKPMFSWSAMHDEPNEKQTACRVDVLCENVPVWSSGWVEQTEPMLRYDGPALKSLTEYAVHVTLRDTQGRESVPDFAEFCTPLYEKWPAAWIESPEDREHAAPYFRREFSGKGIQKALLCVCGVGYHKVSVNGKPVTDAVLEPAVSDFTRTCYYSVYDVSYLLGQGTNCVGIVLGEGWRRNLGQYLGNNLAPSAARFFGRPRLTAFLRLFKATGGFVDICTDSKWTCGFGGYTANNLFDGVTFDARLHPYGFDEPDFDGMGFTSAKLTCAPGEDGGYIPEQHLENPDAKALAAPHTPEMRPQILPSVFEQKNYLPVTVYTLRPGVQIVDFGQNIAGYCRLTLPCMDEGTAITLRYAEELGEDGGLHTANLRGAKCADTYIADGSEEYGDWTPDFTYHGFRYVQVEGYPAMLSADYIQAVAIYTNVDKDSFFRCGSANLNAIHEMCVLTERANLHGIATDCPQRDERMGWMNDATVRFEETPYNFEIGRLFPKITQDFLDEQDDLGRITCTAPFVYGCRPADPVCSSFLILGEQELLFNGDLETLAKAYDGYAAWAECLRRTGGDSWTVGYSCYGDWAGPADACRSMEDPHSSSVDDLLMSTGYLYYNYKLLTKFAGKLGKTDDIAKYSDSAARVKEAILTRWYHPETCTLDTGSQAAQAFGLWLGVIPEGDRDRAAERMKDAVLEAGTRITTGNLCTRYLMDMLAEYGYEDVALALLERQEFPSWGYMMQNTATTVWERFELKLNGGMNSHCHPMYGAVDRWFYSHLLGIRPVEDGCARFTVTPCYPTGLLYAEGTVETARGPISVRWHKKYGKTYLSVNVPFNTTAAVCVNGETVEQGSGFKLYEF